MPSEPQLPYAPGHAFRFLVQAVAGSDTRVVEVEVAPGVTVPVRTWHPHPSALRDSNAKFPGISFKFHDREFCVHTVIKGDQNYFCLYHHTVWDTYGFIGDVDLHDLCFRLDFCDSVRDLMRTFVGNTPRSAYPPLEPLDAS